MSAPAGRYLRIWGWLTALTVVEVLVAKAPWGKGAILLALCGLGAWKALLIAMEFMHLKAESRWLRWAALVPLFLSIMAILLILTETRLFGG